MVKVIATLLKAVTRNNYMHVANNAFTSGQRSEQTSSEASQGTVYLDLKV